MGYNSDSESNNLKPLKKGLHLTALVVAPELDPCVEDVCGPSHLPGYQHVVELSAVLVEIALEEGQPVDRVSSAAGTSSISMIAASSISTACTQRAGLKFCSAAAKVIRVSHHWCKN